MCSERSWVHALSDFQLPTWCSPRSQCKYKQKGVVEYIFIIIYYAISNKRNWCQTLQVSCMIIERKPPHVWNNILLNRSFQFRDPRICNINLMEKWNKIDEFSVKNHEELQTYAIVISNNDSLWKMYFCWDISAILIILYLFMAALATGTTLGRLL